MVLLLWQLTLRSILWNGPYALLVAGGNTYRDPWTISGDTISSPIFTSAPSGNFSVACYYKPFSLVPGKVYQLDFSISSHYCPLISSEVIVNLVGQGGYYTRITLMGDYDPGSFRLSATGYFTVDEAINLNLGNIRAFSFWFERCFHFYWPYVSSA